MLKCVEGGGEQGAAPEDAGVAPGEGLAGELQRARGALGEHDLVLCGVGVEELEDEVPHRIDAVRCQRRRRVGGVRVAKHVALQRGRRSDDRTPCSDRTPRNRGARE